MALKPHFLPLLIVVVLAPGCSSKSNINSVDPNPNGLGEEVSVQTVASMKGKDGVIVIDVREPSEYAQEHIPGVVHIPRGEAIARKREYISNEVVFVTCRSGNRSGKVTEALRAEGHSNVHNMAGGIKAWKKAGLPVER